MPDINSTDSKKKAPIGIFDSGYGGLTILKAIRNLLPEYDYLYLGDNARAPYGTRSYDIIYRYTLEAVRFMFEQGCPLVILGCNTASAKALRTIQQHDLQSFDNDRLRVLGVIRPTVESLGELSENRHVGILATQGTVSSHSYEIESAKLFPHFTITTHACPMWVPLVEYGEASSDGADFFVRREIETIFRQDPEIDTLVLACTHYPLLLDKIRKYVPSNVVIVTQGEIVAKSLQDYLRRHSEMRHTLSTEGTVRFLTTESAERFSPMATMFMGHDVTAQRTEY